MIYYNINASTCQWELFRYTYIYIKVSDCIAPLLLPSYLRVSWISIWKRRWRLECVNQVINNSMDWGSRLHLYIVQGKTIIVFVESHTERKWRCIICQGCPKTVLSSNSYFIVCYFIHYDKSMIFMPVFKYVPVQIL